MIDEQAVELVARRVARRHVEGLEVVPVGLHLGALGDREAEPGEHVLQSLPGLGDDVRVAAARSLGVLGEVESFGGDPRAPLGDAQLRSPHRQRVGDLPLRGVELVTGGAPVVVRGQRAEPGLQHGQRAALAEDVLVDVNDVVEGRRGGDLLQRRVTGGGDVVEHESSRVSSG